jgi:hypothetical protein
LDAHRPVYAAVLYVEAYFAKNLQLHLRSHLTRDKYVALDSNLKAIWVPYSDLKYFGYNARYEADTFTPLDVEEAAGRLAFIKAHISPLL